MTHINTDMMDLKKSIFVTCLFISVCVLQTQAACKGDSRKYECRKNGRSVCQYKSERCDKQDQQCKDLLTSVGRINCRNECPETKKWCELVNKGQCISKGETCKCKGEQEYCTDEISGKYGCSIPSDTSPYERCDDDGSCKKNCSATPPIEESEEDTDIIIIIASILVVVLVVAIIALGSYCCWKRNKKGILRLARIFSHSYNGVPTGGDSHEMTERRKPAEIKNKISEEDHDSKGTSKKYETRLKREDVSVGEYAIRKFTHKEGTGTYKSPRPDKYTLFVRNTFNGVSTVHIENDSGRLRLHADKNNTFLDIDELVKFYQSEELPNIQTKLFIAPESKEETDMLLNIGENRSTT